MWLASVRSAQQTSRRDAGVGYKPGYGNPAGLLGAEVRRDCWVRGLGTDTEVGDWDWGLGLETGTGYWDWILGLEAGTGNSAGRLGQTQTGTTTEQTVHVVGARGNC